VGCDRPWHRAQRSLGLTDEGEGSARALFVLEPELGAGGGAARSGPSFVAQAGRRGLGKLELETFSALAAARAYVRDAGFVLQ